MGIRFFNRYLSNLVNFITDKDADVRNSSKRTFQSLLTKVLDKNEIDKILAGTMKEQNYNKIKSLLKKEVLNYNRESGEFIITNSSTSMTTFGRHVRGIL